MNKKIVLGLTGGITTGKSAALAEFRRLGAVTLDCDRIARDVVKPGQPALTKIRAEFGNAVFTRRGTLNRKVMAEQIFFNPIKRRILERIVHPEVIRVLLRRVKSVERGIVVADIPLLFEARLKGLVDEVVVVYAPKNLQLKRLTQRNHLSAREAVSRIKSQWPIDRKRKLADHVLDNTRSPAELKRQIRNLWLKFQKSAKGY